MNYSSHTPNNSNSNNKQKVVNDFGGKKILRYTHDTLTKELIGKNVEIWMVDKTKLNGKLVEVGMYDILIEVTRNKEIMVQNTKMIKPTTIQIIVLKSAIITVEVL